jgi:hypothetical protein
MFAYRTTLEPLPIQLWYAQYWLNAQLEPEQLPIPLAVKRKNSFVGLGVQPAAEMSFWISAWSCASLRQTAVYESRQPLLGSGLVSTYEPPRLEL